MKKLVRKLFGPKVTVVASGAGAVAAGGSIGSVVTSNNCTRPPHFPPHCGCPA